MTDTERATALFRAMCPESNRYHYVVVPGEPKSKCRPRFSRSGHAYSSAKQRRAESALGLRLLAAFKNEPFPGNVAVGCIFFRPNRQRIDVDNLLKLVMDAATGICWKDDSQVTAQFGVIELDAEQPRTVIVMGEHVSTMDRTPIRSCAHCGQDFTPNTARSKYCSRKCAGAASRGSNLTVACCPTCRREFQRKRAAQRYCSNPCKMAAIKGGGPKGDYPTCQHCGARVSRREYTRCRDCFRAGVGSG